MNRSIISVTAAVAFIFCMLFLPGNVIAQKKKTVKPAPAVTADPLMTRENIQAALNEAYQKFKDIKEGANADYIKELAKVDPNLFGIALVTVDGEVYTAGDLNTAVSIQSISKVFTMARVLEDQGPRVIAEKIGVDATGMRFNSIVAVEMQKGKEINPMVNPGAIAATSLVSGADSAAKWKNILQTYSDFAGRQLALDMPVYISEAGDNLRNQSIAHLLKAYGRMYFDPVEATDVYTKQCAVSVNTRDLAVMASTLANGGLNPVTKKTVVSPKTVMYTLPVMSTAGLYDDSGQWNYWVGLPAKSGVGGGIIAVAPGKFGIAVISPPLSPAGNSVRAQYAIKYIVDKLGVNPYVINPKK
jgi:glutaminase